MKLDVVMVEAFMAREKVAVGATLVATPVAPAAGVFAVTVGAVPIVQVKDAGVASVLPAASVALTWKVWLPTASPL